VKWAMSPLLYGIGSTVIYLVHPASSHMLVSKIKQCMCKHKLLHSEAVNGLLVTSVRI